MHMWGSNAWMRILFLALFILPLFAPAAFPLQPFSELSGSVDLSVQMQGTVAHIKATYLDLSYFEQDNLNTIPTDPNNFHQPGPTATQSITYSQKPLSKPKFYVTFDGHKIADAGGAFVCDPVEGDEQGTAICDITGYIDSSGALKKPEDMQSCGSIMVEYKGEADTPSTHPTSASAPYCPRRTEAIGSLGPAIESTLSSPAVFPICFPVMLIVGMLVASMYYSGRDPLSLFDLTTPRLPKTKPFRVKAGTSPQMIRSMLRNYHKLVMLFKKDVARGLASLAAAVGKDSGEAKRKGRDLANKFEAALRTANSIKDDKKRAEAVRAVINDYQKQLALLLADYRTPAGAAPNVKQHVKDVNEALPGNLTNILTQWEAMNALNAARVPGGGKIWNRGGKVWNWVTRKSIAFENTKFNQFIQSPPIGRFGRLITWPVRAPVKALINKPTKFFDSMMQLRSSRIGQRRMSRFMVFGTGLYYALTTKDKQTGERNLTAFGKRMQAQFTKTDKDGKLVGLGKLFADWKGLNFNKFIEAHDLMRRKAMEIFNFAEFARRDMSFLLTSSENMLFSHLLFEARTKATKEMIEKFESDAKALEAKINTTKDPELRAKLEKISKELQSTIQRLNTLQSGFAEKMESRDRMLENDVVRLATQLEMKEALGGKSESAKTMARWRYMEAFLFHLMENKEYKEKMKSGKLEKEVKVMEGKEPDNYEKMLKLIEAAKKNGFELSLDANDMKSYRDIVNAIAGRMVLMRVLSEKEDTAANKSVSRDSLEVANEKSLRDDRASYDRIYSGQVKARLGLDVGKEGSKILTSAEKQAVLNYLKRDLEGNYGVRVREVEINGRKIRMVGGIVEASASALADPKSSLTLAEAIKLMATARLAVKYGSVEMISEMGRKRVTVCPALMETSKLKDLENTAANNILRPDKHGGVEMINGFSSCANALKRKMDRLADKVDERFAKNYSDAAYEAFKSGKQYAINPDNVWSPRSFNLLKTFGKNPEGVFLYDHLTRAGVMQSALESMKAQADHDAAELKKKGINIPEFSIEKERKKIENAFYERGMNTAEILFQKGPSGEVNAFRAALIQAVQQGRMGPAAVKLATRPGVPFDSEAEIGMRVLTQGAARFVRSWAAEMNTGMTVLNGISTERGKFLTILGVRGYTQVDNLQKEPEAKEFAEKQTLGMDKGKHVDGGKYLQFGNVKGLKGLKEQPMSPYSTEVQEQLLSVRRYTGVAVQIIGSKLAKENAATWGEHALSLLTQNIRESRDQRGTVRELYKSLVTKGSVLYDKAFAEQMEKMEADLKKKYGANFDITKYSAEGYAALIERGIKYGDKFKGLGTQNSADRRGAIPLIEYDPYILEKQGLAVRDKKGDLVESNIRSVMMRDDVRKGDALRDLAPLSIRLQESWYSNLPSGVLTLVKYSSREREGSSFMYRSPYENPLINQYVAQQMKLNPIDRQGASEALVGYYINTKGQAGYDQKRPEGAKLYDPARAQVKMITTQSFARYAKENPVVTDGNNRSYKFFGDYVQPAIGARTSMIKGGLAFAQVVYSATAMLSERHARWAETQIHARFIMEAQGKVLKEQSMEGTERFKFEGHGNILKAMHESKQAADMLALRGTDSRSGLEKNLQEIIEGEMARLEKGKQSENAKYRFIENPQAFWYGFRRNVASRTYGEIANAETALYNARLEIRALDSIYRKGDFSKDTAENQRIYKTLKSDVQTRLDGTPKSGSTPEVKSLSQQYKEAKSMYKGYSQDIVNYIGSHADMVAYGSQRNAFNVGGLLTKCLDSRWVYGAFGENYSVSESSVMRDPRIAAGAGQGIDNAFYVGYQTGQNVYERGWMWTVSASWEKQMNPYLNVSRAAVMFFNNFVSYGARRASHYPSYLEQDYMDPGGHGKGQWWQTFLAPTMLNINQTSDWFKARLQSAVDYTGVATAVGTYQSLGSQAREERNAMQRALDYAFTNSEHNYTLANMRWLQRPMDRYAQFEHVMNDIVTDDRKDNHLRDAYVEWLTAEPESDQKKEIWQHTLKPLVEIFDKRPKGTQEGHSGIDISEDGGRNRFFELYSGFYLNTWRPIMPGTMDVNPVTERWVPSVQIASYVMHDTNLAMNSSTFHVAKQVEVELRGEKLDVSVVSDYMNYQYDAMRDTYRRDSNMLLHQFKLQSEWFLYAPFRTPSMLVINPVAWYIANNVIPQMLYPRYEKKGENKTFTDVNYSYDRQRFEEQFRSLTQKGTNEFAAPYQSPIRHNPVVDLPNKYTDADRQREFAESVGRNAVLKAEFYRNYMPKDWLGDLLRSR